MLSECGIPITSLANSDLTSNVESLFEASVQAGNSKAANCDIFLCKGYQFTDNTANVQIFSPGQVVSMLAHIIVTHERHMNVSIVDTKTNTLIGGPLIEFESYADESLAVLPANNTMCRFRICWGVFVHLLEIVYCSDCATASDVMDDEVYSKHELMKRKKASTCNPTTESNAGFGNCAAVNSTADAQNKPCSRGIVNAPVDAGFGNCVEEKKGSCKIPAVNSTANATTGSCNPTPKNDKDSYCGTPVNSTADAKTRSCNPAPKEDDVVYFRNKRFSKRVNSYASH